LKIKKKKKKKKKKKENKKIIIIINIYLPKKWALVSAILPDNISSPIIQAATVLGGFEANLRTFNKSWVLIP